MKTLEQKQEYIFDALLKREEPDWLFDRTIFLSIHGSNAYGLDTEDSDVDITGIAIPPQNYFYGFLNNFDQAQFNKPDGQIYGITKFFKLAVDNNPNVLELLWIDPKFWVKSTPIFETLVKNRNLFLSKKCRFTYSGYAHAQLNRIKLHKKWLLEPPANEPTREEFGLPDVRVISKDQQGALKVLQNAGTVQIPESSNFFEYLQKENQLTKARQHWDQYNTWKINRNPKRAILEAKFGYDTKHAAHLVRLMNQCKEISINHDLNVFRQDREELLAIRNGAWSYDKIVEWAEQKDKEMDEIYNQSSLRKEPDRKILNELCINIIKEVNN
jgi:hypothetical protein